MSGYTETTQFRIEELILVTSFGDYDLSLIFDELNIFDNMMMPCMSGNILIRDAQNLISKLHLNGDEFIKIKFDKGEENPTSFRFEKLFRIYKLSDRKNQTPTSETYILSFISPEFYYSQQLKVNQYYNDSYSEIARKILTDYLKVNNTLGARGLSGIHLFLPSYGSHEVIIPNLSPLSAVEWVAKRACNTNNVSDYFFFETQFGYNFCSLAWYFDLPAKYEINFQLKNTDPTGYREILGARSMQVITQTNTLDNINNGVYSGTFFGFDPLTRTLKINQFSHYDTFKSNYANQFPNISKTGRGNSAEQRLMTDMFDSKVVSYPFQLSRTTNSYINENYNPASKNIDNTHEYIFQRKAIVNNLIQKRLKIVLPGNFGLYSGTVVQVDFPKYASADLKDDPFDKSIQGKYIIVGSRHIIRYDKHETIIEVATDSTNIDTK